MKQPANAQEQAGQLDEALAEAKRCGRCCCRKHVEQKEFGRYRWHCAARWQRRRLRAASTALADVQQAINVTRSPAFAAWRSPPPAALPSLQARQLVSPGERERRRAETELIAIDEQPRVARRARSRRADGTQEGRGRSYSPLTKSVRIAALTMSPRKFRKLRRRARMPSAVQASSATGRADCSAGSTSTRFARQILVETQRWMPAGKTRSRPCPGSPERTFAGSVAGRSGAPAGTARAADGICRP